VRLAPVHKCFEQFFNRYSCWQVMSDFAGALREAVRVWRANKLSSASAGRIRDTALVLAQEVAHSAQLQSTALKALDRFAQECAELDALDEQFSWRDAQAGERRGPSAREILARHQAFLQEQPPILRLLEAFMSSLRSSIGYTKEVANLHAELDLFTRAAKKWNWLDARIVAAVKLVESRGSAEQAFAERATAPTTSALAALHEKHLLLNTVSTKQLRASIVVLGNTLAQMHDQLYWLSTQASVVARKGASVLPEQQQTLDALASAVLSQV
jgi:hypothetical protein